MRHSPTVAETRSRLRAPAAALALVVVFLLALAGLSGWLVVRGHRVAVEAAEARAETAALVVSAHAQWLFEASFQALRRIDDAIGDGPGLTASGLAGELGDVIDALPPEVRVAVFDAAGALVLSTDPDDVPDRSGPADPVMDALAGGQRWHVEPLWRNEATGRAEFGIARGLWRGGVFAGAAVIVVPSELMSGFWSSLALGPGSSVGLIRDDGWLVARHPIPEATVDLSGHVLFTDHLPAASSGSYSSVVSPADGRGRVVGYTRVPGLPLVAVAGIDRDVVMERYWTGVAQAGVVALPVAMALLLSSLWLVRLLRREEAHRSDLARALEHNETLLREVHHRVKNNLQTVMSLVQMSPAPPELREELGRRIAAMARLHEHVYSADRFGSVDLDAYLAALVDGLASSHGGHVVVHLDLQPVALDSEQALPVGLIVAEAVGNALKHGFPDGRPGSLRVALAAEDGLVRLTIRDDGVGYDAATGHRGMGTRLIDALVQRTGATSRLTSGGQGTTFELTLPLRP